MIWTLEEEIEMHHVASAKTSSLRWCIFTSCIACHVPNVLLECESIQRYFLQLLLCRWYTIGDAVCNGQERC